MVKGLCAALALLFSLVAASAYTQGLGPGVNGIAVSAQIGNGGTPADPFALYWPRPTLVSPVTITIAAGDFNSIFWKNSLTASIDTCTTTCVMHVTSASATNMASNWFLTGSQNAPALPTGCYVISQVSGTTGGTGTYTVASACGAVATQAVNAAPDCNVVWPNTQHNGYVFINGCHNAESIGGYNTINPQGADQSNNAPSRLLYINGATGTFDIQGLYCYTGGATSGYSMTDCIDTGPGTTADIQIQNVRAEGMFGWYASTGPGCTGTGCGAFHSDGFQPFGGAGNVRIHNFSLVNMGYQGLSTGIDIGPIASMTAVNVNASTDSQTQTDRPHSNGGYLFAPDGSSSVCTTHYPTATYNFYLQSNRAARTSLADLILTCDTLTGDPTVSVKINDSNFSGQINWGAPPGGDYAPANKVGLNYPTNGYN